MTDNPRPPRRPVLRREAIEALDVQSHIICFVDAEKNLRGFWVDGVAYATRVAPRVSIGSMARVGAGLCPLVQMVDEVRAEPTGPTAS